MSYREGLLKPIKGIDFSAKSEEDIQYLFKDILHDGVHGFCFSPYEEGQKPGDQLTESQVRRRMEIIAPHTKWVRSFSCLEGNEFIPKIAKEMGLKTLVGAWLGKDKDKNEKEIKALLKLAKEGYVDIAAVGNEVMYRKDLTQDDLLNYIHRVKDALPDTPVGYVDAYYEFVIKPAITDACDIILANCYPYWEGCSADYALVYMKQMYQQAKRAARGKKVIITETGWPSLGKKFEDAIPSKDNAIKYFINAQLWAKDEDIEMFYFSSFDESWKTGPEGDVGAHWGIWDKNEKIKY
jgi:exo-beta-1,3-glucanase (GH17 family)